MGRAAAAAPKYYDVAYRAHFRPDAGVVDVEIALSGERLPSRVVLHIDARRHKKFTSTDPLQVEPSHVTWQPHGHAARLHYQFVVDHERAPQRYDSRMTGDWAILRAEKMVPRASVTARRSLHSRATLEFELPQGWTVATPYGSVGEHALHDRRSDASLRSTRGLDARGQDRQPQRKNRQHSTS